MITTTDDPSARYERKFLATDVGYHELCALVRLHPTAFSQSYPPRFVNSAYFDSPRLRACWHHAAGIMYRCKVRLRWYGDVDACECGVLQFKMKAGHVGSKAEYPVENLGLRHQSEWHRVVSAIRGALPPDARPRFNGSTLPVVVTRYCRDYFVSGDGQIRLTIDRDLAFYDQTASDRANLARPLHSPEDIVVELKYTRENEAAARQAASWFPTRVTAVSKYVDGVRRILAM